MSDDILDPVFVLEQRKWAIETAIAARPDWTFERQKYLAATILNCVVNGFSCPEQSLDDAPLVHNTPLTVQ